MLGCRLSAHGSVHQCFAAASPAVSGNAEQVRPRAGAVAIRQGCSKFSNGFTRQSAPRDSVIARKPVTRPRPNQTCHYIARVDVSRSVGRYQCSTAVGDGRSGARGERVRAMSPRRQVRLRGCPIKWLVTGSSRAYPAYILQRKLQRLSVRQVRRVKFCVE